MRVLVVSGIWPPDVGGPASHAPEVASFLLGRGHAVEVVTTAAAPPAAEAYPVRWVARSLPRGVRHLRAAALVAGRAREADVVYTTGMLGRSASGATLARKPYVIKLTADPAFERARRGGLAGAGVDAFQQGGGVRSGALRLARDLELRGATHVFCPSAWLRDLVVTWGVPGERVDVLPNPAPVVGELRPRDELRAELALDGPVFVFAGRLTAQKSLDVALEAVAAAGVTLLVAGEGPERGALERWRDALGLGDRVRFLGPQPRSRVLELYRAADAALLSSSWENFPHGVVEALAVGTPVVSTAVGGVGEVVEDGVNGLLVPAGDPAALAAAVTRVATGPELRARLATAAAPSVAAYAPERLYARLEQVLGTVCKR